MKRTIFVLLALLVVFVAVFSVLVLRPVAKVKATTGCSNATLIGNYGLVAQGFYNNPGEPPPYFVPGNFSMLATFNGKGAFTANNLNIVVGGGLTEGSPFSNIKGTYTCLPNCTCTWVVSNSPTNPWDAVITGYGIALDTGGDEFSGTLVSANPNTTATFHAERVATGLLYFLP
jgi:hypothetical protein